MELNVRGPLRWSAAMITAPGLQAPLLRRVVTLDGNAPVESAVLHVSSLGIFEAFIGSAPAADDVLSPGWTSYEWRLRYRSYDVTHLLPGREFVLGLALASGWYKGRLGWTGDGGFYGDRLGAIAQLEITFAGGRRQLIVTDRQWSAGPSDTVASDLYDGQVIDARARDDSWLAPGPPPAGWGGVEVLPFDLARLTPYAGPPVRRQETRPPERIWTSPSGRTLIDFGQNLVGWLRFSARGDRGAQITIRHAEVLEHGELAVRPLRTARATDRFILSGGLDNFEPTATFHGFRYAEVTGWPAEAPGAPGLGDVEAVVVHSDLRRTGTFECSDDMLNRLHANAVWSMRGNFVDVPTDCPQRDERLGWTGDLAVFAPSAAFLYDVKSFLQDWLLDLAREQEAHDGVVPFVIPDVLKLAEPGGQPDAPVAIWSDAAVWVPWALWRAYGDAAVLDMQFESMARHVRRAAACLSPAGLWDSGFQFGDWLDPAAPPDQPDKARADPGVVATASLFRSARIVAQAASLTGRPADAAHFTALAGRLGAAFREHYVHADATITSDAPTVYALAITFGLLGAGEQERAGDRLARLVADGGYHVATGFAGTPFIADALTVTGHLDDAYRLLLQRGCPSWLYPVTMGATTIWERWDCMLPDGTVNPDEMISFNHYALGAVIDWMHRVVGGLAPLAPGYREVLVAPRPGGGLTWARASLETPHGLVRVHWHLAGDQLVIDTTLPDGVTGVLSPPSGQDVRLQPGSSTFRLSA